MKKFVFIITRALAVSVTALLLLAQPGQAASEAIRSYLTKIEITKSGIGNFQETIDYNFSKKSHGIYRDIPVVGKIGEGQYLYYDLLMQGVLRDGQKENYTQYQKGSYEQIKIGQEDVKIEDSHVYELKYQLSPLVRRDTAGDYITLNVVGTRWEHPITSAPAAAVVLPEGVTAKTAVCFTGKQGDKESDCTVDNQGSTILVTSTRPFKANEGMTLDIVTESDSFDVAAYNEPRADAPAEDTSDRNETLIGLGVVAAFVALFGAGGFFIARQYFAERQKRKAQTVVPYYDAPDGLLPGEAGLLADNQATTVEVTATLIHLATRGYLTISYEEQKALIGTKKRFLLTKTTPTKEDTLQSFESILLNAVFVSGASVYIDDLKPTEMTKAVAAMKAELTTRLQTKGYFAAKQSFFSTENVTDTGYKQWAKVEGLKLYLSVAEKDRINFHEAPEKTPKHFSKLLPYAIALGVETKWAEHFKGIDVTAETNGWYRGNDRMDAVIFTGLMSNSFKSAVNTSFSPPSSSSGAGGGFSGGGAGGGGGGSW